MREGIHSFTCNMGTRDSPDMYALGLRAYISGKSLVPMLQLLHVSLCVGGSKGKVGIQISCIPESRDTSSCILGEIYL